MPTELIYFCIQTSFRLNRVLWKTPLTWDPVKRKFVFDPKSPFRYLWWYFVIFGIVLAVTAGGSLYMIVTHMKSPRPGIHTQHLIQFALFVVSGILMAGVVTLLLFWGKSSVTGLINETINICGTLITMEEGRKLDHCSVIKLTVFNKHCLYAYLYIYRDDDSHPKYYSIPHLCR